MPRCVISSRAPARGHKRRPPQARRQQRSGAALAQRRTSFKTPERQSSPDRRLPRRGPRQRQAGQVASGDAHVKLRRATKCPRLARPYAAPTKPQLPAAQPRRIVSPRAAIDRGRIGAIGSPTSNSSRDARARPDRRQCVPTAHCGRIKPDIIKIPWKLIRLV
jgi:hypothetical protein